MQQIDRIDVLTTRLAATDRRALSQAWYSALHLAERSSSAMRSAGARSAPWPAGALPHRSGWLPVPRRAPATVAAPACARGASGRRGAVAPGSERRAAKTALAGRLERALVRRAADPANAFTLRAGGGRVRLMVRSEGTRMRVVAICAPAARERVERALAQARFALAGHGLPLEVA
jgi:hypothetical protein